MTKRSLICCIPLRRKKLPEHFRDDDIEYRPPTADTIQRAKKHIIEDDKRGVTLVELMKKEGCGLGLTVVGGIDKGDKPRIAHIRPGGLAHRSDALQVGDVILSVNGIRTVNMKHEEMVNLLKSAEDRLSVELEYQLPDYPSDGFNVICKRAEILLEREGQTFGFTMRGGTNNKDPSRCRPLIVTQVRPGGSANREGSLQVGDRILAINGIGTSALALDEASQLLKRTDADAVLLVEYDVSVLESEFQNALGPLLVEIDRLPGSNFGASLTTSPYKGRQIICVESVRPASTADRCGALHCGDQIISINGTSLEHMTVNEASQLLKSSTGNVVSLEILSLSKLRRHVVTTQVVGGSLASSLRTSSVSIPSLATSGSRRGSYATSCSGSNNPPLSYISNSTTQSGGGGGGGSGGGGSTGCKLAAHQQPVNNISANQMACTASLRHHRRFLAGPRRSSMANSCTTLAGNKVSHSETTELTLVADERGFGFGLRTRGFTSDRLVEAPLIDFVDPGGPADRCGLMQEGDRLLSVNGHYLESSTLLEVNQMLRDSGRTCTLEIEFDVAESVVASSGTYSVKIAKRGGTFGITVIAGSGRHHGDPLNIHSVIKGSVAHRTGVIHSGDKLLSIESVRTESLSVDDALRLLQNVDDIVTLKIRKDATMTEEDDSSGVTYTVEMHRNGGPLGLTLSGTEEPFDPIFVSALTENGIAHRTGAIHVNDELLAINNKMLHGRPLSDAINALKSSGDVITLTVLRRAHQSVMIGALVRRNEMESGDHHQSGDSAVDSWESNATEPNALNAQIHVMHTRPTGQARLSTFQALPSRDSACSADSSDRQSRSSEHDEWNRTIEDYHENRHVLNELETALIQNDQTKPLLIGSRTNQGRSSSVSSDDKSNSVTSSGTKYTELDIMQIQQEIHNTTKPTPTELMKVTLYKNSDTDNFGLSVSDGLFEKGVYISALRPGGPADKCGVLRLYDRLLQVNHIKVRDMDCCLVVPLIAASGNHIDLIVSRNPLAQMLEEESDVSSEEDSLERTTPPPPSPPPSPPLPPPPMEMLEGPTRLEFV